MAKLLEEDLANDFVEGGYTWEALCHRLRLPKSNPPPDPSNPRSQLIPGVAVTRMGCVDECVYDENGSLLESKFRLVYDETVSGVHPKAMLTQSRLSARRSDTTRPPPKAAGWCHCLYDFVRSFEGKVGQGGMQWKRISAVGFQRSPFCSSRDRSHWLQRFGDVGQGTRGGRLGRRRPFGRARG